MERQLTVGKRAEARSAIRLGGLDVQVWSYAVETEIASHVSLSEPQTCERPTTAATQGRPTRIVD